MISVKPTYLHVCAVLMFAMIAGSCSRKSDSWTSRTFHKNTSRFNPYFNGEQSFIEGAAEVEQNHVDDYEDVLNVYRWGSAEDAKSVATKMDRTLEKCAKVITDHSMVIKNKQKNIYVVKSYLLIGKARFYKYDFFPALETFNYIIQQFSKDKKALNLVAEARLWAGRCQIMIGNQSSAEAYFEDLYHDKKIDNKFRADINASMAQMHIYNKNYDAAVVSLKEAVRYQRKKQLRIRWIFIEAQLHERLGNNYEASQAYKDVVSMKPSDYNMMFVAQLNRAKNFDVYMENSNIVYRELNKMLEDEKNLEYKDQIYYVMAEVALAEEEYQKADKFLKLSIRNSVSNNNQKGLSYLKIADIEFGFREYEKAHTYYDSASMTLPQGHKKHPYAKKREESLAGLVKNIKIIQVEDSLQKVALLSPEKQQKLYEDYVEWLIKEEERLKREQEIRELNEQLIADSRNMEGNQTIGNTKGWYFYNTNTRTKGIASFKSKWGNRKLEDSWRQKNKNIVVFDENVENGDTNNTPNKTVKKGGVYDPEYYLAQVPNTPEMLDSSNHRIMRAYVELGGIYKESLEDLPESVNAYENILKRYPGSSFEPRVLFSLYRLYIGDEKPEKAEPYKAKLLSTYPSSVYAKLILNEGKLDKNDEDYKKIAAFYQERFEDYKAKKYKTILKDFEKNRALYEGSLLEPKCDLLETMCYGKLNNTEMFIAGLKEIIAAHPNTPEALAAQSTLDLTDDEKEEDVPVTPKSNFVYAVNDPHKFVAIFPNKGVDLPKLLSELANFNQSTYKLERLQVQNIFFDKDRQMIVVTGLKNSAKAKIYYKSVSANQAIMGYLPPQVTTKIIVTDNNYMELYKTKDLEGYLLFLEDKYGIKTSI